MEGHSKDAPPLELPLANWQRAMLALVAILDGIYGAAVLWGVVDILFLVPRVGSGRIGAVSTGIAEAAIEPVGLIGVALFATSIVANRRLVGWVRRQPRAVAALHRAQTIALQIMAGAFGVFILLVARGSMSDLRLGIAVALLAELALAAQWLLLAPVLTIFAIRAPSSGT